MTGKLFGRPYEDVEQELLYCRQFILGPSFVEVMPGWKYIDIDADLKLSIHPEVDVEQVCEAGRKLTLIGTLLDSTAPAKSNREILLDLVDKAQAFESLVRESGRFGGRWVLLAFFGDSKYLLNDAIGLRQVFYSDIEVTGDLWMVSQPGLAARWLQFEIDEQAQSFMDSYAFRIRDEYSWPASGTALRGLSHLMPNHCLELHTGRSRRCWPVSPIGARSTDQAEEFLTERMTNIVRAAARRFPLALGITAGVDSRVVAAMAKDIHHEMEFVTVRQRKMQDDHPDITVPARLAAEYGLRHVVVKPQISMSANFAKLFKDNVFMATDMYGPDAEAIINRLHREQAAITGGAAEIGQCFYRNRLAGDRYDGPVDASDLAWIQKVEGQPFALKHYQAWLESAAERQDVKLLDLFYWENSHGNWLAMTQLQFDIAWREILTPYNCRDVLEAFLTVEENDRVPPRYVLQRKMISGAWPELLDEPFNPHEPGPPGLGARIRNRVKRMFK